jgi:threonine synthase
MLAQVVYYFAGYFQITQSNDQWVDVSVPSGNFGNVCAGHVAKSMGLPMRRLIVATNENDVLDEFFKTGVYQVRDSKHTFETSSPSMDISKASNFERFIFDLLDRNEQETNRLFSQELSRFNRFDLSQHLKFSSIQNQYGFFSGRSSHESRLETIKKAHQVWNNLIDPHTADGLKVALEYRDQDIPMMVLETALPIKFSETIQEALGISPPMPEHLKDLLMKPKRFEVMGADVAEVKRFISNRSTLPSNPH